MQFKGSGKAFCQLRKIPLRKAIPECVATLECLGIEANTLVDAGRNSLASQLAVLQSCTIIISRILKRGESPLLAAKILVLSRLTHKILSQQDEILPLADILFNRLASLRRKLLGIIDQRLSNPDTEWRSLVEDMCAFSLTTSATPTDVLRHFHRIRLKSIGSRLSGKEDAKENALRAVKLLIQTLHITPVIFPRKLADALAQLKDLPLLQQKNILSIAELNLEVHKRWLAEELRNYTPWPRHDELQKQEAEKLLGSWAKQALQTFSGGLEASLSRQNDFGAVVQLRREFFEAWPWNGRRLAGMDSEDVIDELRTLFINRLKAIIGSRIQGLSTFSSSISETLESLQFSQDNHISLWDSRLSSMDVSNGAVSFKKGLIKSYQGEDSTSPRLIQKYDTWIDSVSSLKSALKEMRELRWNDDISDEVDDVGLDSRQLLLASDDPRDLEESLASFLSTAFIDLQQDLRKLILRVLEEDTSHSVQKCLILLRVIREVIQRSPVHSSRGQTHDDSSQINRAIVDPLQIRLAEFVTTPALARYQASKTKLLNSSNASVTALWEGSPPLPVQPSPSMFRFLRDVVSRMASCGGDIWAPGAVVAVRKIANHEICAIFMDSIKGFGVPNPDIPSTNGHKEPKDDLEPTDSAPELDTVKNDQTAPKEKVIQLFFDLFYVQTALVVSPDETSANHALIKEINAITELDGVSLARIRKSAVDYWRRTYLMFALLATS